MERLGWLAADRPPTRQEALELARCDDLAALMAAASRVRDRGFDDVVTYSPKVFIPLTKLCRDVCHYCTFAKPPRKDESPYLSPDEVLEIARAGSRAGCTEALFTLGDKPELRYRAAREALAALGHETTISYLAEVAGLVARETDLLPHVNPGVMDAGELAALRAVSVSQGIMLETSAARLGARGGPHFGSPDKDPAIRLATIGEAGRQGVPFTSGILIGIGETRAERIEALIALGDLHAAHGHLQEVIVQNFRPKAGTRMAAVPPADHADHLWTIAVARLILGPDVSVQAPPNLAAGSLADMIEAGINDWGGVSPVTIDHVNPERPWPEIDQLARLTAKGGKRLAPRLPVYPRYIEARERWIDPALHRQVLARSDSAWLKRDNGWVPGSGRPIPPQGAPAAPSVVADRFAHLLDGVTDRGVSDPDAIVRLFTARGDRYDAVVGLADELRRQIAGDTVTYVVNRNINYTNICGYKCRFCAFSKGKTSENLRGKPYDLPLEEIARRVREAWDRGATEVCLQGGIHPRYDGNTYRDICRAVKSAAPEIHVHAFSPLEIMSGAASLGLTVSDYLKGLVDEGLGSLPGTAAEVLDDAVRAIICPDKLTSMQWLDVVRAAHAIGLRTTATIMFGHVDTPRHWATHLTRVRALQQETGGFTEFVPLPFVPMETPMFIRGGSRAGPTWRESLLMHAVSRIVFGRLIPNIQASWVKMGPDGVKVCLAAGVNDLGGSLMDETITRSAGAVHGQEMTPAQLRAIVGEAGRQARQRTTLYGEVARERTLAAARAGALHRETVPA